jgi:hypothetical protein
MSESFYYYQKVGFLVHEDIDDGLRLLLRCILPFTLPIVFLLVYVFQEIALLLIGIVVPILLEIWERFLIKQSIAERLFFMMTESRLRRITSTWKRLMINSRT